MNIVVVRALALGDMLCAVPALRSLRAGFPDATITLVGLPWSIELVRRFPEYVDAFLEFPGFPGIPEAPLEPARVIGFIAEMQQRRLDLAIQLHGSGTAINELVCLFDADRIAGFVPPGMEPPRHRDRDLWLAYPSHGSEVDRLLSLAAALGGPIDRRTEFPVTEADLSEVDALIAGQASKEDRLAVVHPGGSDPRRWWPADRFAAVADDLVRSEFRVALTGGRAEAEVTASVARQMTGQAIDLGGRTSLGAAAALIHQASLVVTNDTGISHLAAAVGTDSVTIFSASDRARWEPVGLGRHVAVGTPAFTRTCWHGPLDVGNHRCLGDACTLMERREGRAPQQDVSLMDVLTAVHTLIDRVPSVSISA